MAPVGGRLPGQDGGHSEADRGRAGPLDPYLLQTRHVADLAAEGRALGRGAESLPGNGHSAPAGWLFRADSARDHYKRFRNPYPGVGYSPLGWLTSHEEVWG